MTNALTPEQRFDIRRQVGAGGMGVVFEAFDQKRQGTVALKKLRHSDSSALYRLKREFRSLADVAHPNLVPLYELIAEGAEWFFTMEFVEGVDFLTYVRPNSVEASMIAVESTATLQRDSPARAGGQCPPGNGTLRIDALRSAFSQLAEGVSALHAYGKLHRDLKPSNVLVRKDGRVVILDFGLVADLQKFDNRGITFGGTPRYMSPEQFLNQPVTPASDWYSVGVMLYEALTGSLPDRGNLFASTPGRKIRVKPPRDIDASLPADLSQLAVDLLSFDPRQRPGGAEVLSRIGGVSLLPHPELPADTAFIGRERQVQQMWDAYARTQAGTAVTLLIHGGSGIGKTSLVQHFLRRVVEGDRDAVVLRGRCYEQESVPFKALDNLIDDLRLYAKTLSPLELKAVTPLDVSALTRIFPVLELLETGSKRRRPADTRDSQELRRRAFTGMREMLTRIADAHPLVLFFDDVQWGDRDSAAVLSELLGPPDPPPALVVLAYRTTESGISPFVSDVNRLRAAAVLGEVIDVPVPPLSEEEATELASAVADISIEETKAIARASDGSPFFVTEMARMAASIGEGRTFLSVDDLIRARVHELPEASRRVLEVVAVAGQPLERSVIEAAAGTTEREAVLTLRSHHLVRSHTVSGHEEIVFHHDRFREAVLALLGENERHALHRRLAVALQHAGTRDPELLATHFALAGEKTTAAMHTIEAADNATATLAFDHAAKLYKLALELDPDSAVANDIPIRLADALANAGRTGEAGPIYLRAAEQADARRALELRRRAAESLLRGGHVDEGLKAVREVLAAVGMELPRTPRRALLGIVWGRVLLALHGLHMREGTATTDPDLLMKIDILWAVIIGLARIDNIRSVYFQPEHLRLALDSGDAYRIARALVIEAGFAGTRGGPGRKRAFLILDRTEKHARRVGHPHAIGLSYLAASVVHFYVGEFRRALESAKQAEEIFREHCTGVVWEINTSQNYLLSSLAYLGDMNELGRRVPQQLREARERGDLYAATDAAGRAGIFWLAMDQTDQARFAIMRAMEQWSLVGFHFQHFLELGAHTQIDLYLGDSASAIARIRERWPALKRSMLLRIQFNRIEAIFLRARAAAAEARRTGDRSLLEMAERDARLIAGEKMRWARPLADSLYAAAAAQRGDRAGAVNALQSAVGGFDRMQMSLFAAAARWQLAGLLPDQEGRTVLAEAEALMSAHDVRRPDKLTKMLIAGF